MDGAFVRCPYDPRHRVIPHRILEHIVECQKNYPDYQICPYNATHRMPQGRLPKHILECPALREMYPPFKDAHKKTGDKPPPTPKPQREELDPVILCEGDSCLLRTFKSARNKTGDTPPPKPKPQREELQGESVVCDRPVRITNATHGAFVSCPYDPSHRVLRRHIHKHIVECQKDYPDYQICPYNATHRMPPGQLPKHILECAALKGMYPPFKDARKKTGDTPTPPHEPQIKELDPDQEYWW